MWLQITKIKTDPEKAQALMALTRNDEVVGAVIATGKAQTSYVLQATQDPGENDIQTVDLEGLTALIATAQAAGVSHLIYTSFSGNVEPDCPLRDAKRAADAATRRDPRAWVGPEA